MYALSACNRSRPHARFGPPSNGMAAVEWDGIGAGRRWAAPWAGCASKLTSFVPQLVPAELRSRCSHILAPARHAHVPRTRLGRVEKECSRVHVFVQGDDPRGSPRRVVDGRVAGNPAADGARART